MSQTPSKSRKAFDHVVSIALIGGVMLWLPPNEIRPDPFHYWLWMFGALLVSLEGIKLGLIVLGYLVTTLQSAFAFTSDNTKGSAFWMTERMARKLGLHRRRKESRFVGTIGTTPLWLTTETHTSLYRTCWLAENVGGHHKLFDGVSRLDADLGRQRRALGNHTQIPRRDFWASLRED